MTKTARVRYLCEEFAGVEFRRAEVPRRGPLWLAPGQGEDGYGAKISTDYQARVGGRGPWLRVYCVCWSNAGSLYVLKAGAKLFVRDRDFPDAVRSPSPNPR